MKIKIEKTKQKNIIQYIDDNNHVFAVLWDDFFLEKKSFYRFFIKRKNKNMKYLYRDVYIKNEKFKYVFNKKSIVCNFDYLKKILKQTIEDLEIKNCLTIIY